MLPTASDRGRTSGKAAPNTVMIYTEPRLEDLAERMERVEQSD